MTAGQSLLAHPCYAVTWCLNRLTSLSADVTFLDLRIAVSVSAPTDSTCTTADLHYLHMLIHLLMLMRRLHMYTHWRYILLLQTFTIPGLLYAQRVLGSYPLTETVQLCY